MDLDTEVSSLMAGGHHKAREDMIMAILSDTCVAKYDFNKRPYLLTDFSKRGFGYNLCQPADDPDSLAAMKRLMLKFTGFGSRRARDREADLHSHLGKRICIGLDNKPQQSQALECEIYSHH